MLCHILLFSLTLSHTSNFSSYILSHKLHSTCPLFILTSIIDPTKEEKVNFYTKEQLSEFLSHVEAEDHLKQFAFFRLLSYSGMPRGEVLALDWRSINFDDNTVRINKSLATAENNVQILLTPKTRSSIRMIKMDQKSMDILAQWKKEQDQYFKTSGLKDDKKKRLLFSNKKGEFLQLTAPLKWLVRLQEEYNLHPISLNGFRHTHYSLLFKAGATLKEAQDRLGHNDVQTTMNIYTHVTQKAKEETAEKFIEYMSY